MDWKDNPQQAEFRQRVQAFVAERLPERYRAASEGMAEASNADGGTAPGGFWQLDRASGDPERVQAAKSWSQALASQGWVAPHWPQEYGGAGLSPLEQFIFNQVMAEQDAPQVGGQGVSLLGPTLIVHGTPEQKQEHLSKILSGDIAWAQGYSEPGAGSDLASLQTRAVRDGDEYVLNGQKIWTSGAQYADWLFALVRTDPDAPKHRGISFLMMDIKTPGITVRPLMDASWHIPFNETFFEDARVPVRNRLGEENRGWYVAVTLLDFERSNINTAVALRRNIQQLIEYAHTHGGDRQTRFHDSPTLRLELADRYIETEVLFNFAFRIVSMQSQGVIPNYEASMNKLFGSDLRQAVPRTAAKAFGLYTNLWDPEDAHTPMHAEFTQTYVRAIPATIAGGSNEVQRNIIATRGLGLPRG